MMQPAGQFNERIEIWQTYITRNEFGEEVNEFNFKNVARCKVRFDKGERLIENQEIFYSYIRTFVVRDYVDINEFNRIKYKNHFYRVLNIQPIEKEKVLIIQTELVND